MAPRLFSYVLVVLVVLGGLGLITVVSRNPDTHGHLWTRESGHLDHYTRTPLDTVRPADLEALQANLMEFRFPPPPPQYLTRSSLPGAPAAAPTTEPQAQLQRVTLRQFNFGFDPTVVRLTAGVPVELTVINEGGQAHGILVFLLGIQEDIPSGESKVFNFVPEKTGRIQFECNNSTCGTNDEHAQMSGTFIVEPGL